MLASGHRLRAWGEACDARIAGRTLRCARIGGGAMGAALGRSDGGDRANRDNRANGLRWQRMGSMVWRCLGSAWRLEPPCLFGLLGLFDLFALPRLL